MSNITYLESIVIGALQGVSELFPVSSLGHSVLVPKLIGGQWAKDLDMAVPNSPYLSLLVAMHLATAIALIVFFWSDWVRIIAGLFRSIRIRKIDNPDARLGWLLIVATIPVGVAGLALHKVITNYLSGPITTSIFLAVNGGILFMAERLRSGYEEENEDVRGRANMNATTIQFSTEDTIVLATTPAEVASDVRLSRLGWRKATIIGAAQILALMPGISRSGSTMAAGLFRGLRHEDSARFSFLLSTPVILAAALIEVPKLFTPANQGLLGPALAGSVVAGIAAYFSVRFLTSYFETRTLTPFAIYCGFAGLGCLAYFSVAG
jgi:undecaprenyl-diphosphatase